MKGFLAELPNLIGIAALMFSTFLIGYFYAFWAQRTHFGKIVQNLREQVELLKNQLLKKERELASLYQDEEIEAQMEEEMLSQRQDAPINLIGSVPPPPVAVEPSAVEEIEEEEEELPLSKPEAVAQKARTSYISYTRHKPELDFDSFGLGDPRMKDDLTKITGIGPYIQQRLNEIGIYNYDQISQLKPADIKAITELIDFFPGRIERDDWIGQATALKVY
jgi:predicted flap endonuclease-1-like 5' DNA nuclease